MSKDLSTCEQCDLPSDPLDIEASLQECRILEKESKVPEEIASLHTMYNCFKKLGGNRSAHFYSKIDLENATAATGELSEIFVSGMLGKEVFFRYLKAGPDSLINVYVNETLEEIREIVKNFTLRDRNIDLIKAHIVSAMLNGKYPVRIEDETLVKLLRDDRTKDVLKAWNPDLDFVLYRDDASKPSTKFEISWHHVIYRIAEGEWM